MKVVENLPYGRQRPIYAAIFFMFTLTKNVDQGLYDQVSQPCVKIPELCFNIKTIFPDIGIPIIR